VVSKTQATREIIAKTTCGSGVKTIEYVQYMELDKKVVPDQILGCFVTNYEDPKALKCKAPERSSYFVPVNGTFDIYAWYSYNNGHDTAVINSSVIYHENVPIVNKGGRPIGPVVATAKLVGDPVVADVKLEGNKIRVEVLLQISAEVVGDSRLVVEVAEMKEG
jgi:spore coat protein E